MIRTDRTPTHPPRLARRATALAATLGLAAGLLAACGGGGGADEVPDAPSAQLSGSVAVGVPLTDATLRVVDANGAVVASDIVVADDGTYTVPQLTGTAPWRLEACGHAGGEWVCVHSVAQGAGTANVTPLTQAAALLASGGDPGTLMDGDGHALGAQAMADAQSQLRNGLTSVLAGVVADGFDFVTGSLAAGSRTGYDRVLDSIGVHAGTDGGAPFVQITPRLGNGNLLLAPGATTGSLSADTRANNLPLAALGTLFSGMSSVMSGSTACMNPSTGLASYLSANARLSMEAGQALTGPTEVATGLCAMFDEASMWGATLVNPTLGRCNLDGAVPMCRVSFALRTPDGATQALGGRMGVTVEGGQWRFLGDPEAIAIQASATAQRDRRVDGASAVDTYSRALAFEVPALPGLACAKVSQRTAAGDEVAVALYKRWGDDVERLSLWTVDGQSNIASLDAASGALRSSDDTWLMLPQGPSGDDVIRNFFRGGREVQVDLYADSGCSTAFQVDGRSRYAVDIEGLPPLWDAMPGLPWPELASTSVQALTQLQLGGDAGGTFSAAWTWPRGPLGLNDASFCGDRATCGSGGPGRLGETNLRPGATSVSLGVTAPPSGLEATAPKMLALSGRTGDGLSMQANFQSCAAVTAGLACEH